MYQVGEKKRQKLVLEAYLGRGGGKGLYRVDGQANEETAPRLYRSILQVGSYLFYAILRLENNINNNYFINGGNNEFIYI